MASTPKRIIVSEKGFIGMACSGVQLGDTVCLIIGCTTPVILREVASASDGDQKQFTVIGEVFVYLSMDDKEYYRNFRPLGRNWPAGGMQELKNKTLRHEFQLV